MSLPHETWISSRKRRRKMADRTDSGNDVGALIGTGDKSLFERVGLWLAAGDWHYTEGSEGNWY